MLNTHTDRSFIRPFAVRVLEKQEEEESSLSSERGEWKGRLKTKSRARGRKKKESGERGVRKAKLNESKK